MMFADRSNVEAIECDRHSGHQQGFQMNNFSVRPFWTGVFLGAVFVTLVYVAAL